MGLKADLEEVTGYWARSPWRVRVFLAIALFLSATSLASISEAVFKWKGFILEALDFYRQFIAGPIGSFVTTVTGLAVTPQWIDSAVLLGLFLGALARVTPFRHRTTIARLVDYAVYAGAYLMMLALLLLESPSSTQYSVWLFYPAFVLAAYLLTKGATRILAMSFMLFPVLLVGVLAGVNTGLSK